MSEMEEQNAEKITDLDNAREKEVKALE